MSKPIAVVLFIILAIAIFVIGGGLGVLYQTQQNTVAPVANTQCTEKMALAVKALSSQLVSSIIAYGQVENINGRNITLSSEGKNLTVSIENNATISLVVASAKNSQTTTKTMTLQDIKKGDSLNIDLKVSPDGSLSGRRIYILPVVKP